MSDIATLNQIVSIIDEKASSFKTRRTRMPQVQAAAEKKLIMDLLQEGINLAQGVAPKPTALIEDLERLNKEFKKY